MELEAAVMAGVPDVAEAAAVGVARPGGGPERLVLHVVLRPAAAAGGAAPAELLRACQAAVRQRLNPLFKVDQVRVSPPTWAQPLRPSLLPPVRLAHAGPWPYRMRRHGCAPDTLMTARCSSDALRLGGQRASRSAAAALRARGAPGGGARLAAAHGVQQGDAPPAARPAAARAAVGDARGRGGHPCTPMSCHI